MGGGGVLLGRAGTEQDGSTCSTGTQCRVPSIWGLGSDLVSRAPCVGDALGVVKQKNHHIFSNLNNLFFSCIAISSEILFKKAT